MTAQCLGIPEAVQRPLQTTHMNVVQLNVADGSTGMFCFIYVAVMSRI